MEEIARSVLDYLGNNHTKIEKKEGFIGNYYSPLIDTIFLAEDFEDRKKPDKLNSINENVAKLITVCHECVHSVQNKWLHVINTVFSNLALLISIACVIFGICGKRPLWLGVLACLVIVVGMVVRLILEAQAINRSIYLAKELTEKQITQDITSEDMQNSILYINKHKLFALIQMVLDKIILLILVLVIH